MCKFFKKLFSKKKEQEQLKEDEKVFCECELIEDEKDEVNNVEQPIQETKVEEVQENTSEEIVTEDSTEETIEEVTVEEEPQVTPTEDNSTSETLVEEVVDNTPTEEVVDDTPTEEVVDEVKTEEIVDEEVAVQEENKEELVDDDKDTETKKYYTPLTKDDKVLEEGNPDIPHGKFVIKKTDKGNFVYKLYSYNHRVVCIGGEQYKSQVTCKNGIHSVMNNCNEALIEDQTLRKWEEQKCPKWQIYKDKQNLFRFRLLATNGQSIATTNDGYKSKEAAKNGIEAIKRASEGADLIRNDVLW